MPSYRPMLVAGLSLAISQILAPCASAAAFDATEAARLDQVVVSASAIEQSLRDAPAAITVITREELQMRPVRDVLDAIREVPGVSLRGVGFTRRGIQIRGLNPGQTLYLIDGRRVSNSADVIAHADFELSWIPIEAIERIEVVRGPLSSLYGSEALGGVVNIITRPVGEAWGGSVRMQGGTPVDASGGDEFQIGAYGSGRAGERFGLRMHAESQYRGNTPVADDPEISDIEGRRLHNVGATLAWYLGERQRLELMAGGGEETRSRRTRGTGPLANTAYGFYDDISRRMGDLRYTAGLGAGELQVGAYQARLKRENRRELTAPSEPTSLRDDILDAGYNVGIGAGQTLLVGAELRRERLDDAGFTRTGEASANRRALFVQDQIRLADSLIFTLGGRWDRHEDFGTHFTPRAYLNWHLGRRLTVRGGYGEGFKAPTLKQLSPEFETVGGGGRFRIGGNPGLRPETSRNREIGLLFEGDRLRLETTVFQNDAIDLIETACVANCGAFGAERREYVNVARARILGVESGIGADLAHGFGLGLSHTWLDAEDRSTGQALVHRPRHAIQPRLDWRGELWALQLRAQYTGRQETSVGPGRLTLPAYTLWHLNLSRAIGETVTLRAGLENLTDLRLAERSPHFGHAERGRFLNLGIDWSF